MKVYAFVPAKGNSERVENKNMRFLDGERLYIRALKTLLKCREIDRVFLDTESEEMYQLADYLPITFMKRDKSFSSNKTDGHQLFLNEVKSFPQADIYVQLLCTSPFIMPETIDRAILSLKQNECYDSALLMKKDKCYFWKNNRPVYDINHIPNSIDLPETICESMGLYLHKKESALRTRRRYGKHPLLIFGQEHELIDVNTAEDLIFAEVFAKGLRSQENRRLNLIKHFVSSPALSDLLDDMNAEKQEICGAVLPNWTVNLPNVKVLGRANTLKLRKLNLNEDFTGIYKALNSYEGITENNIICVENEVGQYAYFGDLNARLAIRSGAIATVIDGATRDVCETRCLNYPVAARGYSAMDVRRRATVDYINKPIFIGGHKISPGDLIFLDECALVVIYQKYEDEVIRRVLATFKNESGIIHDILSCKNILEITDTHGHF